MLSFMYLVPISVREVLRQSIDDDLKKTLTILFFHKSSAKIFPMADNFLRKSLFLFYKTFGIKKEKE